MAEHLPDLDDQKRFERTVARHWRLRQGLINGHSLLRSQAAQAQADLNSLIADDATSDRLAARLMQILDNTTRTSSLIECINGLIKVSGKIVSVFAVRKPCKPTSTCSCSGTTCVPTNEASVEARALMKWPASIQAATTGLSF